MNGITAPASGSRNKDNSGYERISKICDLGSTPDVLAITDE